MNKLKKLEIDISTEEKRKKVCELFSEFNKICEIYAFFGVEDTPYNNKYVHKIADEIGFDFSSYREKRKRFCLHCGKELKPGQKKFCSSSCAAKHNNSGRKHSEETKEKIARSLSKTGTIQKKEKFCLLCGKELKSGQYKFCCNKCYQEYQTKQRIDEWIHNPENFSGETISSTVKRYLMTKYDCKCQKCGWGEMNETTGKIPLEVHHINGDCTDNREENLQLLCPNCHSLTPNHGSLNRGSKRYKLKKYKDLIKS